MKKKNFDFDEFNKLFSSYEKNLATNEPFCLFAYGSCSFLITECSTRLASQAIHQGTEVKYIDFSEQPGKILEEIWHQSSLFSSTNLYLISNLEKSKEALKILPRLLNSPSKNFFIFQIYKDSLPKDLEKHQNSILCNTPLYQNLPKSIQWLASHLQVKIESSAVETLVHLYGNDLLSIVNAMKIASLVRPDENRLTTESLRDSGAFMREDDALKLANSIMAGGSAESLRILHDLIERGQSPLGILGLLSRLARTSLQFLGGNPPKLPPNIARQYATYAKRLGAAKLGLALTRCSAADMSIKSSSKASDYHILADVLGFF